MKKINEYLKTKLCRWLELDQAFSGLALNISKEFEEVYVRLNRLEANINRKDTIVKASDLKLPFIAETAEEIK